MADTGLFNSLNEGIFNDSVNSVTLGITVLVGVCRHFSISARSENHNQTVESIGRNWKKLQLRADCPLDQMRLLATPVSTFSFQRKHQKMVKTQSFWMFSK